MNAEGNLNTVKRIYESFGTGDVPAILDQLTDDVDWCVVAGSDVAPWYGQRTGKDEVRSFFEALSDVVDVLGFSLDAFAVSEDEVMVLLNSFSMKSKQTGREASMTLMHYWHLRDGKVDRYRGTEDTAQTLDMLG
jgi:ketosteroid isomerase-like protein